MTNLEFYKDELKKRIYNASEVLYEKCLSNGIAKFTNEHFEEIEFNGDPSRFIDWLCEEYKEPIKLKQWEYDLIETNDQPHNRYFNSFMTYQNMKDKGHFKGVYDTNMTLMEILENCEVVDDNC